MNLPKTYEPNKYEADIYKLWEEAGIFKPDPAATDPFCIIMPPPNANAPLHSGHALFVAVQDTMVRYARAKGRSALYLPGADHAGFETWAVYEKHLAKEGKSRFDFTSQELYQQTYDFVQDNRGTMESQLRAMGASCDWSRLTFTLDDNVIKQVNQTFKKMWDEGLIYRGERLVNYCTKHQTSFSDIEVEYVDRKTPLYYMKYGPFTLATTRPETKFGDTAIAVHPDDPRYQEYIGTEVEVEGLNGTFKLKVIADEMVDKEFGTGAVKITPAHDPNDYEVAQRHDSPMVTVINFDGTMNEKAGKYSGMKVEEARQKIAADLDEKGLLVDVDKKYKNRVGICYKCDTVIQPLLKDQWFVDMKPLAEPAVKAITADKINFEPANKKDHALAYLTQIRDWNISRQIPWGIAIPAFQNVEDPDDWIYNESAEAEIEVDGKVYRKDEDTFDTWFSSAQWPYTTLGYPNSDDFKKFYPTAVMETGGEIFNQWVLRMIMMGLFTTGEVPFKDVYIHGYVLAEDGKKMSKSVGNVINPIGVLEEYGSDALRMGILSGRVAGVPSAFSSQKIIGARNFANKLWNVARFIEGILPDNFVPLDNPDTKTAIDNWIIDQLNSMIIDVDELMDEQQLARALELIQGFVWDDLADWYIEASKTEQNAHTLAYVLDRVLRILHPFAPFLTETIWQTLSWGDQPLAAAPWPEVIEGLSGDDSFEKVKQVITELRQIDTVIKLKDEGVFIADDNLLHDFNEVITRLSPADGVVVGECELGLPLASYPRAWLELTSNQLKEYKSSLQARVDDLTGQIKALDARLTNKDYVANAPQDIVEESRQQVEELLKQQKTLASQLEII